MALGFTFQPFHSSTDEICRSIGTYGDMCTLPRPTKFSTSRPSWSLVPRSRRESST